MGKNVFEFLKPSNWFRSPKDSTLLSDKTDTISLKDELTETRVEKKPKPQRVKTAEENLRDDLDNQEFDDIIASATKFTRPRRGG